MKRYLYISQAKLDVLIPQVESLLKRPIASASVKVDLKVISAELKAAEQAKDPLRVAYLEPLLRYIQTNESCGGMTDESEYIYDVVDVALYNKTPLMEAGTICFAGMTRGVAFSMRGSECHLVGASLGVNRDVRGSFPHGPDDDPIPTDYLLCHGHEAFPPGGGTRLPLRVTTLPPHGPHVSPDYGLADLRGARRLSGQHPACIARVGGTSANRSLS